MSKYAGQFIDIRADNALISADSGVGWRYRRLRLRLSVRSVIIRSSLIACRSEGNGWFPVAVSGVDAAPGLKSIHRTHDSLIAPVAALTLVAIRPTPPLPERFGGARSPAGRPPAGQRV